MKNKILKRIPLFLFLTTITFILIFRGYPLIKVILGSFIKSHPLNTFVGIENYLKVLNDTVFWETLLNSILILIYIPILIFISLITAYALMKKNWISNLLKSIIIFPQVISTVVIATLFASVFSYNGPINSLLDLIGIPNVNWFGNKDTAFAIILLCILYTMYGWQTLIFSGALSTVDSNIIDLMRLDGQNIFRRIFILTKEIQGTIFFSIVLNFVYGFSGFFPIIYILTKGGPAYSTTTIDYLIYLRAFRTGGEMSDAYTLATLLIIIIMSIVSILFCIMFRKKNIEKEN